MAYVPPVPIKKSQTVAKTASETIKIGEVINNRFTIIRILGEGGFGAVYEVEDDRNKERAAAKLELQKPPPDEPDLTLETNVLRCLQNSVHFTKYIQAGEYRAIRYLIMELVDNSSKNISELRRACPDKKFTTSTSVRVSLQMFEAIEHMHKLKLLHRDVKQANFTIGLGKKMRIIYLLDFGLVRKYVQKDGSLKPARPKAPFRVYSLTSDFSIPQGTRSVLECHMGDLPFPGAEVTKPKLADIKESLVDDLFRTMDKVWRKFYDQLVILKYGENVPYEQMTKEMHSLIKEKKIDDKEPYDWEDGGVYAAAVRSVMAVKEPHKQTAADEKEKATGGTAGGKTGPTG
uniref:non-specific serine/threonine protein kinase n=1 Tax=Romanomermis culicivorax TaxID=13658 RepID=A0A915IHI5_ROMCU